MIGCCVYQKQISGAAPPWCTRFNTLIIRTRKKSLSPSRRWTDDVTRFLLLTEALLVNSSCPASGFLTYKTVIGLRTTVNFQSTINHPSSRPSIIILGLKFSLNGYFNDSNSSPTKTSQCFLRKSRGLFFPSEHRIFSQVEKAGAGIRTRDGKKGEYSLIYLWTYFLNNKLKPNIFICCTYYFSNSNLLISYSFKIFAECEQQQLFSCFLFFSGIRKFSLKKSFQKVFKRMLKVLTYN